MHKIEAINICYLILVKHHKYKKHFRSKQLVINRMCKHLNIKKVPVSGTIHIIEKVICVR